MDHADDITREPLLDDDDVEHRLTQLLVMDEPPYRRTLWLVLIGPDDRQLPVLVPVDDVPDLPDPELLHGLARACAELVDGGSVAFTIERPGADRITPDDASWARGIHGACADADVRSRGVFVIARSQLRRVTLDDAA